MITLKKSFETQNYLKKLFGDAISILSLPDYVTTTKQEHMRKRVYPDAEDEVTTKPRLKEYNFTTNELLGFVCDIESEIEKLTNSINSAKFSDTHSYDGMISVNANKRQLLSILNAMANIKSTEKMTTGRSVKFNEEGNQVEYRYDIKEVTTIDFDRNKVKGIISKLRKEADETSENIDEMLLSVHVDYDCPFEIGDSLEDAVTTWLEKE